MMEILPTFQILDGFDQALGYSDGAVEERLLALFSGADEQAIAREVERILQNNPTWPERAHLSPQRQALLDWYPFRQDAALLELGAGCGALTGLLCDRVARVDAVDLSVRRAQIVLRRHRGRRNLRVLVGDLASLAARRPSYDYVVAVGVLEYAGRYVQPQTAQTPAAPYQQFLRDVHALLARGGTLLLAIENQLGAKYLAGGAEDHYGQPLVGVEDYPVDAGIRTFGKAELHHLIDQAGLQVVRFYYPLPDYKLPTAIYSDDLPPGSIDHISLLYPSVDFAYPRGDHFDEGRFMHAAARNGLATTFANAFLVECQRR
jgi:2-polyprenyl-3-methyl-5-hydroxy-6-metoxy-1,4-benzoquinol methylase